MRKRRLNLVFILLLVIIIIILCSIWLSQQKLNVLDKQLKQKQINDK